MTNIPKNKGDTLPVYLKFETPLFTFEAKNFPPNLIDEMMLLSVCWWLIYLLSKFVLT